MVKFHKVTADIVLHDYAAHATQNSLQIALLCTITSMAGSLQNIMSYLYIDVTAGLNLN